MPVDEHAPDMPGSLESLMTAQEVAKLLRISRSFVYAAAKDGRLPALILGRSIRFSPKALREFIGKNHPSGT